MSVIKYPCMVFYENYLWGVGWCQAVHCEHLLLQSEAKWVHLSGRGGQSLCSSSLSHRVETSPSGASFPSASLLQHHIITFLFPQIFLNITLNWLFQSKTTTNLFTQISTGSEMEFLMDKQKKAIQSDSTKCDRIHKLPNLDFFTTKGINKFPKALPLYLLFLMTSWRAVGKLGGKYYDASDSPVFLEKMTDLLY